MNCLAVLFLLLVSVLPAAAQPYFVAPPPQGNDANPGTMGKPFASLPRALNAWRRKPGVIYLRAGTHYLTETLVLGGEFSGSRESPTRIQAYASEQPVLSGGRRLANLDWKPKGNGIFMAQVPADLRTEELFVNGERQILARYPNLDPGARYFQGFAADALSRERASRWADPAGGYFHAMHPALWGDFTWKITGKEPSGEVRLEGGWQNNRGGAIHPEIRFVENIFEELDSEGEWYLDEKKALLYFFPPSGLDLKQAVFEAVRLRTLVTFRGDQQHPVRFVTLRGLTFRHCARTVMETREPLLRSDWAISRSGAVFFQGAEDCALEDCFLDQPGGNAVFVNHYNRRITLRGLRIDRAGASGVCFVGDPQAARNPLFHYSQVNRLEEIDRTAGPRMDHYPADCRLEDSLITRTGRVEKQTAGIHISLSMRITVRHCSVYDMPRAGINIGDGCWGGHRIEFCDVFDTVKETGDHGSFNSWGRDRYWRPKPSEVNEWIKQAPELPRLDAIAPVVLHNNRWRCDHGWDIDLDDGSSFYTITGNLCLHGGIKNREGYGRIVENNILIGSGFHPHVWYAESGDIFRRNIVSGEYRPALMPAAPWGREMDYNLVHRHGAASRPAEVLQRQSGRDEHSILADANFVDPGRGDFRVRENSPALALGFVNFPMDRFGVQNPALKALARTPEIPALSSDPAERPAEQAVSRPETRDWMGATVRSIAGEGEKSAFGLPEAAGVLILQVRPGCALDRAGLKKNDVVFWVNGERTRDISSLFRRDAPVFARTGLQIVLYRNQEEVTLEVAP